MPTLLEVLAVWAIFYWTLSLVGTLLTLRYIPVSTNLSRVIPKHPPVVSALIPACDEADTLPATLRRLLAEGYPALELVVVNDRSQDATGAILDQVAASDARVRALHVKTLPEGWLGKVHALHVAEKEANGAWLLVMDADVQVQPGTIGQLVAWCEAEKVDYLTVIPRFEPATFPVDVSVAAAMRSILGAERPYLARTPKSTAVTGFGAFNLVRRSAFQKTEGFSWLRLEVADDLGLAQLMKDGGHQCAVMNARDQISLKFYSHYREMTRRLEKNAYAILGQFSLIRLILMLGVMVVSELSPLLGLISSTLWARILSGLALVLAWISASATARWLGMSGWTGLFYPLGTSLLVWSQLRGGMIGWRKGGISWRGTFYAAETLRRGRRVHFP